MLRTFVEAKSILRHKARFPNNDLKLRFRLFTDSLRFTETKLFSEISTVVICVSDFLNLLRALLGLALQIDAEEDWGFEERGERVILFW